MKTKTLSIRVCMNPNPYITHHNTTYVNGFTTETKLQTLKSPLPQLPPMPYVLVVTKTLSPHLHLPYL